MFSSTLKIKLNINATATTRSRVHSVYNCVNMRHASSALYIAVYPQDRSGDVVMKNLFGLPLTSIDKKMHLNKHIVSKVESKLNGWGQMLSHKKMILLVLTFFPHLFHSFTAPHWPSNERRPAFLTMTVLHATDTLRPLTCIFSLGGLWTRWFDLHMCMFCSSLQDTAGTLCIRSWPSV